MSASKIPNLNTLRRVPFHLSKNLDRIEASEKRLKDEAIQNTDNDAATSRLSAVDAGYLDDPFASLLITDPVQRRLPLMNRGTYVRTVGIDKIVDTFLALQPGRKQIISLGAGSDTRYFRLRRKYADLDVVYHEFDFETNTKKKIERLKSDDFAKAAQELCSIDVNDFQTSENTLIWSGYNIHPQDLRKLPDKLPGIKTELPTLLISECCLIYLSPEEADKVVTYFTEMFSTTLAIAIYEPIRPNDPFGRTMVRNLVSRGIHLKTLEKYAELDHQRKRLQDHQFEAFAEDIDFIWRNWIGDVEKARVEGLEWMDEIEEFVLFAKHYCISWGWKGWNESRWTELPKSGWNAK